MKKSAFIIAALAVAATYPLTSSATLLVELTGTKTITGAMETGTTAFLVNLQTGGKPFTDFDPNLGTLRFSALSIGLTYSDNTVIAFEPVVGRISGFNAAVAFPSLGSSFNAVAGNSWQCPENPTGRCTTGGGPTIKSMTLTGENIAPTGFIAGRIENEFYQFQGTVSGNWALNVDANFTFGYDPFSRNKYLQSLGLSNTPSVSDLNIALEHIKSMRELDATTSGQNENLRNAEYYLRDRVGMLMLRGQGSIDFSSPGSIFDDVANMAGPSALLIYNGKKYLDIITGRHTAGEGELPNSAPGGLKDAWEGWVDGFFDNPIPQVEEAPENVDIRQGPLSKMSFSTDPNAPLRGFVIEGPTDITAFYIETPHDNQVLYFDPLIEDYLTISSQGSKITSFVLTDPAFSELIKIYVGDKVFQYVPGSTFSFLDAVGSSIFAFGISGFPDSAKGLEATFGLQFSEPGDTIVMAFSGYINAIPEPETWLMFLSGLILVTLRIPDLTHHRKNAVRHAG